MKNKLMSLVVAAGLSLSGSLANASAILGLGGQIFATGGNVVVDILPSDSGYRDEIDLFYAYPDLSQKTIIGYDNELATINLGTFSPGQELVFGIIARKGSTVYGTYVLGDGSRNGDGKKHGWVQSSASIAAGFVESWDVGFEDLLNGGDKDYNDAIFRVRQTAVPEPGSLALLACGLVGLGLSRRRQA